MDGSSCAFGSLEIRKQSAIDSERQVNKWRAELSNASGESKFLPQRISATGDSAVKAAGR